MPAKLIKGDEVAARLREDMVAELETLYEETGRVPGLAAVIVGEDPASLSYVTNLEKSGRNLGFNVQVHRLPAQVTEGDLLQLMQKLNYEVEIDGIMLQLPLPEHLDEHVIMEAIDPEKDVDGAHPVNMGKLFSDEKGYIPSTVHSVMRMIEFTLQPLYGKSAVLIGRSNIVGKPLSLLMLRRNATLTICHSYTQDLPEICREADIVVAATGNPGLVKGDWIKPGAIVIDVGVTQVDGKLVGDVDFAAVRNVAGWISPVPGGIGPITIAMLKLSTLEAFKKRIAGL